MSDSKFNCPLCGKILPRGRYSELCLSCETKEKTNIKNNYLSKLKDLSIEERLTLIEEWMYKQEFKVGNIN